MKEAILNHLQYLSEQGVIPMREHQCRETTTIFYMPCGCVVFAEINPSKNPLAPWKHYTIPCSKHEILRHHNYSFPKAAEIRKQQLRDSFNTPTQVPDLSND